jgi:hypothetical protein
MIIHFKKPSTWQSAFIHYWNAGPGLLHTHWHGHPMIKPENDDDWWHYELSFQSQPEFGARIVFNDGKTSQTRDFICRKPEALFMDGDIGDFNPDIFKRFAFPGGKYKALVMSFDDSSR